MKVVVVAALALFSLAACDKAAETPVQPSAPAATASQEPPPVAPGAPLPPNHPAMGAGAMGGMPIDMSEATDLNRATVISHIDIPQFTYLEVEQDGRTRWLASTTVEVKDGEVIEFAEDSTMADFHSKTLDRTFDTLTFVSQAAVVSGE